MSKPLPLQIIETSDEHAKQQIAAMRSFGISFTPKQRDAVHAALRAATISGISLATHYLAANDGAVTAQQVERAAEEAGRAFGMKPERMGR
jgi:Arc/MetJ family transcription regulator